MLPQYAGEAIGSSTTSPNYQVNWTSLPTNGSYSVIAVGTDNATNSTTSTPPIPVTVDGNGPTGGMISVPMYVNTLSVTITKTNFTDSASGMASNKITRSNGQAPVGGSLPDERLHRCHHGDEPRHRCHQQQLLRVHTDGHRQ